VEKVLYWLLWPSVQLTVRTSGTVVFSHLSMFLWHVVPNRGRRRENFPELRDRISDASWSPHHEMRKTLGPHHSSSQLKVKVFCKTMLPYQDRERPEHPKMR